MRKTIDITIIRKMETPAPDYPVSWEGLKADQGDVLSPEHVLHLDRVSWGLCGEIHEGAQQKFL
jgi:hypothetical protein